MKTLIRTKLLENKLPQRRWTDILPEVQLAMNSKQHSSTKLSPFQLMHGTKRSPMDNTVHQENEQLEFNTANKFDEVDYNTERNIQVAKENLRKAAETMKGQHDKKVADSNLQVGDQVYIRQEYAKRGESKKLNPVYDQLSTIIESNSPIYKIRNASSGKEKWIHHNRLRLKQQREIPAGSIIIKGRSNKPNLCNKRGTNNGAVTRESVREGVDGDSSDSEGEDNDMPVDPNMVDKIPEIPLIPVSRDSEAEGEDTDLSVDPITAEESPSTPVVVTADPTTNSQDPDLDNETVPLLHLDADVTMEGGTEAMDASQADINDSLGRTIDDLTGRSMSLRGHKPSKKHEDFVYK